METYIKEQQRVGKADTVTINESKTKREISDSHDIRYQLLDTTTNYIGT